MLRLLRAAPSRGGAAAARRLRAAARVTLAGRARGVGGGPATMRAVHVLPPTAGSKRPGPESLACREAEVPKPGAGEVLIRVVAAGVNGPDVMQRLGLYAPPAGHSPTLGLEVSGVVAAVGDAVTSHAVGDRVCALTNGGGYAEFCAVPAAQALPVPEGLSMVEAACVPETFFTVWWNMFQQTNMLGQRLFEAGATPSVLVHGGSSGIGTTAIQLARAFGARSVIVTAGSQPKCEACLELGATRAVDYRTEPDFEKAVLEETDGRGVDLVLDMVVGKGYLQKNLSVLRRGGRLAIIGFKAGAKADANMTPVLTKGLTVSGSTLRSCSGESKAAIASEVHGRVWPLLSSGSVRVVVDGTFELADAGAAHARMESSEHVGKICLTARPGPP